MTVLYLLSKHTDHFCSVSLVSKALWINEPLLEFKRSLFSLKIALRAKMAVKKQHKRLYPAALREIVHLGLIFHLYKAGKTSNLQGRRISPSLPNKLYESAEPQTEGGSQSSRLYSHPGTIFLPTGSVCPWIGLPWIMASPCNSPFLPTPPLDENARLGACCD